jgi:tetratricopeptide (TPR) repeat protein
MQSPGVDNMCHLGGFVSGLLLGLPMGAFARRHRLLQLATVLATCAVLFVGGRELVQTQGDTGQLYRAGQAWSRGDYASAIPFLEKYAAANPNNDAAWVDLGDAYQLIGQSKKAMTAYQQALKINPESADAKEGLESLRPESQGDTAPK